MSSFRAALRNLRERALAPVFLVLCILFGGASGGGAVANAGLQLLGLLIILLLVGTKQTEVLPKSALSLVRIALACAALLVLQLVPLPPALWMLFPGHQHVADGFRLAAVPLPWLPISLTPDGTIAALLSLLPPIAMFLATVTASSRGRRTTVHVLLGVTALSILIGMLQQIHALSYIYAFTSFGGAVGFFANRNHLATLCLMAMPFAAALAISAARAGLDQTIGRKLIAGSLGALLIVGCLVVQSIAGWIFLPPMLLGCLLLYERGQRGAIKRSTAWVAATMVFAGLVVAVVASLTIGDLGQQASGVRPGERREIMRLSLDAAREFFPIGSGAGSFVALYPSYEDPATATRTYVNHAHDDYIEWLLEGGLPGALLLIAFIAWGVRRLGAIWGPNGEAGPLARAGLLAILAPLAHSLVDYPFRTAAIAAVAGMACGMLVSIEGERTSSRPRSRRRASGVGMIELMRPTGSGTGALPAGS